MEKRRYLRLHTSYLQAILSVQGCCDPGKPFTSSSKSVFTLALQPPKKRERRFLPFGKEGSKRQMNRPGLVI